MKIAASHRPVPDQRGPGGTSRLGKRYPGVSAPSRALLPLLLLALAVLAAGCGNTNSAGSPNLAREKVSLGYVRWDESVAIANLTKVLLEDELGYEEVELRRGEAEEIVRDVASGDLDAFQDVWLPSEQPLLDSVEGRVGLLNPWLIGTTRSSLAVPAYMGVRSLEKLDATGAERVIGVEPGAAPVRIPGEFWSRYPLERDLDNPSAAAMLEDVDRLYEAREPFVFLAYSPHWMNEEYNFNYLEDPDGVLEDLTQPERLHPIVRKNLRKEDPLAWTLIDTVLLTEYQVHDLELAILDAGSPEKGARAWMRDNEELVQTWIDTARTRSERAEVGSTRPENA